MQILDDFRGALGALLDNARASAPHLAAEIEALNAKAAPVIEAAEAKVAGGAAAAPVLGAALVVGAQLGEGGLEAFLTAEAAPYLGPAAAPLAKVFVEGGARAVTSALSAAVAA